MTKFVLKKSNFGQEKTLACEINFFYNPKHSVLRDNVQTILVHFIFISHAWSLVFVCFDAAFICCRGDRENFRYYFVALLYIS